MMGVRAAQHPDKLWFTALTANGTCYDAQSFFSASHSFGDSGTQSNDVTFAAATGTTPTVAEFRDAFRAAVADLLAFKDDRGENIYQPTVGRLSDIDAACAAGTPRPGV
jgi:phage major head subunit gpT-like protein